MRTRRNITTGMVGILGAAAVVIGLTANGQDRLPSQPKTDPGKVSPPAGGAGTTPRPYGHPNSWSPPPGNRPRITSPVIAGPNGVRTVSPTDPVSALPPPSLPPGPPPPIVGSSSSPIKEPQAPGLQVEPPSLPKLPDPKPLDTNPSNTPVIPRPTLPPVRIPGPTGENPPPPPATDAEKPVSPPGELPSSTAMGASLPARTAPNLTIDAVVPDSVSVGQPLTYELVVRNVGTSAVMNVRVEDEVPARATLLGTEPSAESAGGRLAWSIGLMEPGVEKRIKVTVRPTDEGEISSRAMVSFASAVESRVKVTRPRIAVAMSAPETARVGKAVPFQIRLSNSGSGTASRVLLQARFTDGLTHPHGQVIEAEIANLAAGETRTLTLEATGTRSGTQMCQLTATADGSPAESARAGVMLVEPLLVLKQSGPPRCLVKSEPTYQLELSNPGTDSTDPVQVWATLPAGFEFVSATDGGSFVEANRAVGWRLPGLAAGATKSLSLKLRAVAPSEGTIQSVAVAQAAPIQPAGGTAGTEPQGGKALESRAETAVRAEGVPALRFEVFDLEDPVVAGKEAVYEIRVVNQGTGPCTNVQLTAELGEGTVAVGPAAGPTGSRVAGQQVVIEPIPQLGVKAEVVYRVRVKGVAPGDHRFRVRLSCNEIKTAVVKEESTRFYKE